MVQVVNFFGRTITNDGMKPNQDKLVNSIRDCREKSNSLMMIRSFVGFVSSFQRYIKSFGKITGPLYVLMKKEKALVWTNECELAFLGAKENYDEHFGSQVIGS